MQVVNTHLDLLAREGAVQVEALLGDDRLGHPARRGRAVVLLGHPARRGRPVVLLGDLNAVPRSRAYGRLAVRLRDAQCTPPGHRPRPAFPARWPLPRMDHVFLGEGVRARKVEVRRGSVERTASDHLPLVVDPGIRIPRPCRGVKGRTRCMQGFKSFASAERFCRSHDELRSFLRLQTRYDQHVPASRRRLLHLRRATAVLAILGAS